MNADVHRVFFRKERISLRLWVFKFIDYEDTEAFGVSVEGYRPNDQTETILRNWHSTAIEERISSSLLVSHSGSIYELRGCIDKDLAHQYGYPAELVSMFANGFPKNWRSILKKYFHIIKSTATIMASHNWSAFAHRRCFDDVRERDQTPLGNISNTNERSTQLPTVNTPVASPCVVIDGGEGDDKANTFYEPVLERIVSPSFQQFCKEDCSRLQRSSSIKSKVGKIVNNAGVGLKSLDCSSRNISNGSALATPEFTHHHLFSTHSSYVFIPHHTEDSNPVVHSPTSVSSQSLDEERSAGPIFIEPNNTDVNCRLGSLEREANLAEIPSHSAILPRSYDISKLTSPPLPICKASGPVELSEWSIRFAPVGYNNLPLGFPAFVILGSKEGHLAQWQTSIVTRVESAHIFCTTSSKYRLIGNMNVVDSANAGFPKVFVAKFLRGFPPDWRTSITDLYNSFFSHLEKRGSRLDHLNPDVSNITHFRQPLQLSPHVSELHLPKKDAKQSSSSKISQATPSKKAEPNVRRSRSGRCIHAPLAEWAGQRVRYDGFGNVIGVQDVTTVTIHSKGAVNTSDLCSHYGVSSAGARKQSESFLKVAAVPIDRWSKKSFRKQAYLTCSDSSDDVDKCYHTEGALLCGDRFNNVSRAHHEVEDESSNSISEEQLRIRRRLILKKARQLQKEQEKLLDLERRIATQGKNCRRNGVMKQCLVLSEVKEGGCVHQAEDWRRSNRKKIRGRVKRQDVCKCFPCHTECHDEEICCEGNEEKDKRFEEEWARENEQLHTDYDDYDDEDDEWCEPIQKRKKVPVKKTRTRLSSAGMSSSSDERNDKREVLELNSVEEPCVEQSLKKERSWHKTELQRLKLALAAIHVGSEDDWEKVSRSLGGERDPESCKQAAIKRLKWKPTYLSSSPTPEITSDMVTARVGTIAHHHQMNEFTRKFMMGGGIQGEDYFIHNTTSISNSIPDVTKFCADDSLLEAINTPVEILDQRKVRNVRREFLAEPVDDDTPPRRRSSGILIATPTDSAQRERQARYCHHILKKGGRHKDISHMNFSRAGNSTCFERTQERERSRKVPTFGDLHENLEKAAKIAKRGASRQVDMDDSSLDLEIEDDFDENSV